MITTIMEKQVVVDARTEATAWEGKARQQKLQQVTSGIIIIKNIIKDESSTVGTMNNEHEQ